MDAVEEFQAVHVAGQQPAFEQVEGQDFQTGYAQSAVEDEIAVHLFTSFQQQFPVLGSRLRAAGGVPPFVFPLYLMTVFCSKNENGGRKSRLGGGLRKAFLLFLQADPPILKTGVHMVHIRKPWGRAPTRARAVGMAHAPAGRRTSNDDWGRPSSRHVWLPLLSI